MKTLKLIMAAAIAAVATGASGIASAQGYWTGPGNAAWKNAYNQCWRTANWTPAMATAECDPDLIPKPAARPAPAPAAKPAAKPAPAKPVAKPAPPKPVVLRSSVSFASNQSVLDAAAKARLDADIIGKLGSIRALSYVTVKGHADRVGSPQYNQKLSDRRAAAVKAYLVSRGMDAPGIEVHGHGETLPVTICPEQKDRKALNACLEGNRRVEVEVQGSPR